MDAPTIVGAVAAVGGVGTAIWLAWHLVRNPPVWPKAPVRTDPTKPESDRFANPAKYWTEWYDDRVDRNTLPYIPWVPLMIRLQQEQGARNVLSLGAGMGLEPYLWADCGFQVTAVDVCPTVLRDRLALQPEELSAALERAWGRQSLAELATHRKPGGSVTWLQGDFRDPTVAPGQFDVVEISRTLQYYINWENQPLTPQEAALVEALLARVQPEGTLLIGMHGAPAMELRILRILDPALRVAFYSGDGASIGEIDRSAKGTPKATGGRRLIFRCSTG